MLGKAAAAHKRFARLAASARALHDHPAVIDHDRVKKLLTRIELHERDALAARSEPADFINAENKETSAARKAGELRLIRTDHEYVRERFTLGDLHETAPGLQARTEVAERSHEPHAVGCCKNDIRVARAGKISHGFGALFHFDKGRERQPVASCPGKIRHRNAIDTPGVVDNGEAVDGAALDRAIEAVAHLEIHERTVVAVPRSCTQEALLRNDDRYGFVGHRLFVRSRLRFFNERAAIVAEGFRGFVDLFGDQTLQSTFIAEYALELRALLAELSQFLFDRDRGESSELAQANFENILRLAVREAEFGDERGLGFVARSDDFDYAIDIEQH